jgi:voltage-gated potassium channel
MTSSAPRSPSDPPRSGGWRHRLHEVIFEADTPSGRAFDIALLLAIVASVLAVLLESVPPIRQAWGKELRAVEWGFTALFTVEYVLRLASVRRPLRYATSFFGLIDLLAILPSYLSLALAGAESLLVIRALRLLRVFRVLKLAHFLGAAEHLQLALRASLRKVLVFLLAVLVIVLIAGSAMYLIEGEASGFTSIPQACYWAIVTMTTVGYGDITPVTLAGKLLASALMILGYGIIAVPTGIISVEMASVSRRAISTQACPSCAAEGHPPGAGYCFKCGAAL